MTTQLRVILWIVGVITGIEVVIAVVVVLATLIDRWMKPTRRGSDGSA